MIQIQIRIFLFFSVFTLLSCFAFTAEEAKQHKEKKPSDYKLKVGDHLVVSLYGEERSKKEVMVGASGAINFENIISVPAVNRTVDAVRHSLTERLKEYYVNPLLGLTLSQTIGDFFSIVGEVRAPGRLPLLGNPTLLTALCQAGGFTNRLYRSQTIDLMDFKHSFLTRDGEYVPVDFEKLVVYGDLEQNVKLKAGDFIYIASYYMPKVYVLGLVNRPVAINYLDTISLAEAIAEAGGRGLRASSRVVVIRGSLSNPKTFVIDFNRIAKAQACNFWLEEGDIVYVPPMKFTTLKEYIQGGINSFVSTLSSVAGTNTFLEITPAAKNSNVISPIPTINSGATQTAVIAAPASATATAVTGP